MVVHDFAPGGAERIALRLARYWHGHGAQVTIVSGAADGPQRELVPADLPVVAPATPIARSFTRSALAGHVRTAVVGLRPDIVFLPGNYYFGLAFALRGLKPRPKVVGKISNAMRRAGEGRAKAFARTALLRLKSRFLDRIVLYDESLLPSIQEALGGPRQRFVIGGHPVFDVLPASDDARPQPGRIMCAGRLVHQKDFALAIEVLARLPATASLHIYGGGPLLSQLQAHANQLGVAERVHFAGHVPDLTQAYRHASLYLLTSRYEGFGTVAVEALGNGVPVVATDCSLPLRDLLGDPALGTVVASREPDVLADAVHTRLAAAPADRQRLREAAAPYLLPHVAERFLDIFAETLRR